MARYRLLIEYDGTDYHGWQRQPNERTVQADIEQALTTTLRHSVSIIGSGRTDAGVHARGQVAHFDSDDLPEIELPKLIKSLNALTPRAIAIRDVVRCADEFHARYDAFQRRYAYHVTTIPIGIGRLSRIVVPNTTDFHLMNEAAAILVAKRNYSCFCLTQSETKNRVCEIVEARWVRESRNGEWEFRIAADRFLHGMVRAIAGTLLEIGRKSRSVSDLTRIIDSKDRRQAGPAAPASGLVLEEVLYREDA